MVQEVAHLRTEVGLFTKMFTMMNSKKVNKVGSQGKASISYDSDLEENTKYLD